jgi:ABC-type phosphate transport system substrate-binding protein
MRAAALLVVTAIIGVTAFSPAAAAQTASYTPIVGQGSSYAYIALNQWATNLESQGLDITYTGSGSEEGRTAYIEDQDDFAGSDIAFLLDGDADPFAGIDATSLDFAYSYIPDVAGGLAFLYNLQYDGHRITNLRLSGETLAKIFTGQITNWDNPEIEKDYGGPLPNLPIRVVTRSDGAGESYFLSNWLLDEYPSMWISFCEDHGGGSLCEKDPTEYYPHDVPGWTAIDGANDLAGYIQSSVNNGSIGYAEDAYAIQDDVPVVSMLNAAGYYVQPTAANVAIALEAAKINPDENSVEFLMQTLNKVYTDPDPRTYPLSSYSYLIVPRTTRVQDGHTYGPLPDFNTAKGKTLSTYVNYILCGAQQSAQQLGYSPLPQEMVQGGFEQEAYIPGAVKSPAASNYSGCDNPAYLNGKDVLTATAPLPNKCQHVGEPLNCNPNAPGNNPNSTVGGSKSTGGNSKSSGDNSTASGNSKSTSGNSNSSSNDSSSQDSKSSSGSSTSINPNTGQVESSTGQAANDVSAQPVGLASQPAEQWLLGVLAAVLLLAVVAVPAGLGTWLQRAPRRSRDVSGPSGPTPPYPSGTPGSDTGR